MYMFGAINVILFVFVWFCIPETKGVSLEHMDVLFGGIDHADGGAAMVIERGETVDNDKASATVTEKPAVYQAKSDSAV
jgi:hypothetical protein